MSVVSLFLANYGASTARVYAGPLAEFEHVTGVPIERASVADVERYRAFLDAGIPEDDEGSRKRSSTIYRKLSTLSAFFAFLQNRGDRADDPTRAVRRRRYRVDPAETVKYLDEEQARAIRGACRDPREAAMVTVLLHGLRVAEACGLSVEQVRDGALVGIVGKGSKVRSVPLTEEGEHIVRTYIGDRQSGPLFLNRSGGRLGVRGAQNIVYAVSDRTGHRISAHQLRHSAATHWYRAGVPLDRVGALLGHAKADTTKVYAKLSATDLYESVRSVAMLGSGAGNASPAPARRSVGPGGLKLIRGGRHG